MNTINTSNITRSNVPPPREESGSTQANSIAEGGHAPDSLDVPSGVTASDADVRIAVEAIETIETMHAPTQASTGNSLVVRMTSGAATGGAVASALAYGFTGYPDAALAGLLPGMICGAMVALASEYAVHRS
ncbi:hypothetical protein [Variovorax sp. KK3]|uniref:hypothetical protein n=1 Tax=Variovorax sp. KK3 TaxID=1855728 RepID=UPI00097C514F|nr:hypothetical protein [Variovorax sp. KK3]